MELLTYLRHVMNHIHEQGNVLQDKGRLVGYCKIAKLASKIRAKGESVVIDPRLIDPAAQRGVCVGCGAVYPTEVEDLFQKPGTEDEYCKDCMEVEKLQVALSKKVPVCPYCDGDGILGYNASNEVLPCMWCEKGQEVSAEKQRSKLFTTKEGMGATEEV